MSNYLQLCQDLRREASISGTGPSATASQTGEYLRVTNWIKQAWIDIQNRHQAPGWRWLRSPFTVNTVAEDDTYAATDCTDSRLSAAITRFRRWWLLDDEGCPAIKCYLSSAGVAGENYLTPLTWNQFRDIYKRGTQTSSQPQHVAVDPQNNLVLGPKPSAVYVVSGEYQMSAQILAANDDTPEMPSDFHSLIWRYAMQMYAGHQAAPEAMARAISEGNRQMRQLERDQLPEMRMGGPLA